MRQQGAPVKILVTGFGRFPGAPYNPTEALMQRLAVYRPRLRRLGIHLDYAVLPVVYAELAERLARLLQDHEPDGALHFGLSSRRFHFSIETRALNRCSPLRPDAAGKKPWNSECPRSHFLQAGGPMMMASRFPARMIVAALDRRGIPTRLSQDAGDYLCNMALYQSCRSGIAATGFIHVPLRIHMPQGIGTRRVTASMLDQAALMAIELTAHHLRSTRQYKV
ncbi:pyroglutamyl-peptidase I family protein [Beijerinckia mobilis]|uniref:pyroglutamyl-peptidase I family protein n=1 Tax=Beijerinckia mobilis TaxID=231434 RepID=UPI0009FFE7CD|nr:hypothetical protein [Beijerinckia mobilis]